MLFGFDSIPPHPPPHPQTHRFYFIQADGKSTANTHVAACFSLLSPSAELCLVITLALTKPFSVSQHWKHLFVPLTSRGIKSILMLDSLRQEVTLAAGKNMDFFCITQLHSTFVLISPPSMLHSGGYRWSRITPTASHLNNYLKITPPVLSQLNIYNYRSEYDPFVFIYNCCLRTQTCNFRRLQEAC